MYKKNIPGDERVGKKNLRESVYSEKSNDIINSAPTTDCEKYLNLTIS